ncbi:hypothetical protein A1OE_413 [Candidatus Endolissoclinum faulkneri L2]|uniref:Uncharacterized protein n=1 Tax=Candidatus Endolissoclinum faulkneri L2 TaxID=1193729 RepID=K7ZCI2_9PROT|nr:hypothetical protein A1OE_413 [Candidatus Endolissoclinum faulkneri L2]
MKFLIVWGLIMNILSGQAFVLTMMLLFNFVMKLFLVLK